MRGIPRRIRMGSGSSRAAAPRSDLSTPPAAVNALLSAWMQVEARLAQRSLLPFGLSLFAVLRRRDDPGGGRDG